MPWVNTDPVQETTDGIRYWSFDITGTTIGTSDSLVLDLAALGLPKNVTLVAYKQTSDGVLTMQPSLAKSATEDPEVNDFICAALESDTFINFQRWVNICLTTGELHIYPKLSSSGDVRLQFVLVGGIR